MPHVPLPPETPAWQHGVTVLGRYSLEQPVARGGQGVVYRATDVVAGHPVAVKRVLRGTVRRETTALMAARFPGLVTLLDQGEWGGSSTLVMQWLDGTAFPGPRRGPEDLRALALALLDVLDRLHALGIVHRDVKPSNVRVSPEGRPTLLDLGLARGDGVEWSDETAGGGGTLRYVAPEQLVGGPPDPRSDLYSLGVMLYEALSGTLPHEGSDLVGARLGQPPVPLARRGVAETDFTRAVDRLVARKPHERFPEAREAARAMGARSTLVPPSQATKAKLRSWLRGPERVSRTRTLAAELLVERCGTDPDRLAEELARWERQGVLGPDRVVDPHRFRTLRAAARVEPLIRSALETSDDVLAETALAQAEDVDLDSATATLSIAVHAVRDREDLTRRLLRAWELPAMALGTPAALEALLVAVRRCDDPELADLERAVHGALLVARGEPQRARVLLEGIETIGAHVARLMASRHGSEDEQRAEVDALERFARATPGAAFFSAEARAILLYRLHRFREAAQVLQGAVDVAPGPRPRLAAMMWQGASLLEVPDLDALRRLVRRGRREARRLDLVAHEGWMAALARAADYRSGCTSRPDGALIDALDTLGLPALVAFAALTEAAVAWRHGRRTRAAELAARSEQAARSSRNPGGAVLAGALRLHCGMGADREVLGAEALRAGPPGVAAQALALLAASGPSETLVEEWRAAARARAWWSQGLDVPREVLAPAEVREGFLPTGGGRVPA